MAKPLPWVLEFARKFFQAKCKRDRLVQHRGEAPQPFSAYFFEYAKDTWTDQWQRFDMVQTVTESLVLYRGRDPDLQCLSDFLTGAVDVGVQQCYLKAMRLQGEDKYKPHRLRVVLEPSWCVLMRHVLGLTLTLTLTLTVILTLGTS